MDQKFSLTAFGAWLCWALGLVVAVVDIFVPWKLLGVAIAILVAGLCLTVRHVVRSAVGRLSVAFSLGREAERRVTGAGVRSV